MALAGAALFFVAAAYLAAGTSTGQVCLWRVADRMPLLAIQRLGSGVRDVALSGDGQIVASNSQDGLLRLWEEAVRRENAAPLLRLDDYLAAGGLKASLSRHADEILAEVSRDRPERARIARCLFCLLTAGEGQRAVRRLAPVAEIAAVSEQHRS